MNKRFLALLFCLGAPLAHAQMLQPGLWELTTSNMQVDGQPLPDLQLMLNQLKSLAPDQQVMMEQAMQKQGVTLAGKGVQVCLDRKSTR